MTSNSGYKPVLSVPANADEPGVVPSSSESGGKYANRVRKCCFKKRYLIMGIPMGGVEKTVALGIKLKEDL